MALNAKQKGSPIGFVFPKEGVPAVTEPVAILKTTQNPAAAKAFVDFILSDEGQQLAASQGYVPAKSSIPAPSWLPSATTINIMSKDLKSILSRTDADKKRFAEMFGG
jgi:iron(III) transport system substrate-binding protein